MASTTSNPVVLLVNCFDSVSSADTNSLAHPLNLLKDIPELTTLDDKRPGSNTQSWYWTIDNKYYTAKINVVVIPSPLLPGTFNTVLDVEEGLVDRVEALILCCGNGKKLSKASFNLLKHWKPFVDCCAPAVRLAVCEGFEEEGKEDSVKFAEAIEWCIENSFELVQFDEGDEEEEDDEDEDRESNGLGKPFASGEFGVPRILAALHAHMWSNLTMKDSKPIAAGGVKEEKETIASGEDELKEQKTKNVDAKSTSEEDNLEAMFGDFQMNGDGADDDESFEQLFNKMAHLKSQSQNLQFEDRKAFAEQVTMAFWRAIGGDEDELDGLDEDI